MRRFVPVWVAVALFALSVPATAQTTYTWTGTTNANWSTANTDLNWSTSGMPSTFWANGTSNTAVFAGAAPLTITPTAFITTNAVQFSGNDYTIASGSALNLAGTAPSISVSSGRIARINTSIPVTGNAVTVSGGGTLRLDGGFQQLSFTSTPGTLTVGADTIFQTLNTTTGGSNLANGSRVALGTNGKFILGGGLNIFSTVVGGNITLNQLTGGSASRFETAAQSTNNSSLTLDLTGGGTTTFDGVIGYVGGSLPTGQQDRFQVTVNGSGTFVLNGANEYSGATSVGSGATLRLGNASALGVGGSASVVTVNDGATLDLNGQTVTGSYSSVGVRGPGVGAAGVLVNTNTSTAASLPFQVRLDGGAGFNSNIGGAGNLTLSGQVINPGRLVKVGAGTLTLSNSTNNYTGGTLIDDGRLELGAANALPGTGTLLIDGGTLSTGATTGFGDTDAGILQVTGTGSKILLGSGNHTLTFDAFNATGFTSPLIVEGWTGLPFQSGTGGKLVFTDASALTPGVLAMIQFPGFGPGAVLISGNEVVPNPEPGAVLAVAAVAGGGWTLVRRVRRRAVS